MALPPLVRGDIPPANLSETLETLGRNRTFFRALFFSALGLAFFGSIGAGLYLSHQSQRAATARNALYGALHPRPVPSEAPTSAATKAEAKNKMDSDPLDLAEEKSTLLSPQSVEKLQEIERRYNGTQSAFEARMQLGKSAFDQGKWSEALPWYELAVRTAPSSLDRIWSHLATAQTLENLEKYDDAIVALRRGLGAHPAEDYLRAELMFGIARNYERMHNSAEARNTYDRLIAELPSTDYSQRADAYRALLD